MFIMPVVLTMLIVARQPMAFTGLGNRVTSRQVLWVILISILAIPAMNCLVAWNENIHFPQSMAGLESVLRGSEERARGFVDMLMGGDSVTDLLLGILIMGVLTGFAEELFSRGGRCYVNSCTTTIMPQYGLQLSYSVPFTCSFSDFSRGCLWVRFSAICSAGAVR